MEDGSQDLSENIAVLFDYFLMKAVSSADVEAYIDWVAKNSGNDGAEVSEAEFLTMVSVPGEMKRIYWIYCTPFYYRAPKTNVN